jgi:hypothetical protein
MLRKIILLICLLNITFAFSQSMLDRNKSTAIKNAQIKRCVEVLDGKDLWTMYYDTNGLQIKNSFFAPKLDSSGKLIDGFYGYTYFKYDDKGNLIEKKSIDPISDSAPYKIIKYKYNNENQIINEELSLIIQKMNNEIDTEKVITQFYYSNSKLVNENFKSSKQTIEKNYSYDDSNRLSSFTIKENNNIPIYTKVYNSGDTTFQKKFDNNGNEIYIYYHLKQNKGNIEEYYMWEKKNNIKFKKTLFYNELDLISKIEVYNYISNQLNYTYFRYEKE